MRRIGVHEHGSRRDRLVRNRSDRNEDRAGGWGAASVEFALLTTAIAAAVAGVVAMLQVAVGEDLGMMLDALAQLVQP